MNQYKCFENLHFDPDNYNPLEIGKLSHLLRHDPEKVRRKIQTGEWTIGDLKKAIQYLEDYEKNIRKNNPDWQPRRDVLNIRDLYKDLLIRIM